MAEPQKTQKKPQDPYAQRGKALASAVQRLRGWVGSDPSRTPELADALVELTAHRLLGHSYSAAATDAQEAVQLAAQLMAAKGPIGPYTSVPDSVRCLTTLVQLAALQAGLGRLTAAGQTVDSVSDLQQQLSQLLLGVPLAPQTTIWAAWSTARAALFAGDVARANTAADAALDALTESGLRDDPDAVYLPVDADRVASDCRWAVGLTEDALAHVHAAQRRYDELVAGRLSEPGRLSPALVERLAEPLFGLYRDLADRLLATGEIDLGLAARRTLVDTLRVLAARLGDPARLQLGSALADLASDLLAVDRVAEAEAAGAEAAGVVLGWPAAGSWRFVVAAVQGRVLTRAGRGDEAVKMLRSVLLTDASAPSAAQVVALMALAEALQAGGEPEEAGSVARQVEDATPALLASAVAGSDTGTALYDLARGVVSRGSESLAADHEQRAETAAWVDAERSEAHEQEMARMAEARVAAERRAAEQAEAERAAAERLAAELAEAERAERAEAERQAAAEEAERLAVKRRREERLEEHRLEAERLEAERLEAERQAAEAMTSADSEQEELRLAQEVWHEARARADRRATRAANERVVELLRLRAQADLAQYGWQLRQALEELASVRLRGGDLFGSRSASREVRALSRTLGG